MADKKISQLTAATALTGAETFAAVQSGVTKKATATQIATYVSGVINPALTSGYVPYWNGTNFVNSVAYQTNSAILIGTTTWDTVSKVQVIGGPIRMAGSSAMRLIDLGGSQTGDWTIGAVNGKVTFAKSGVGDHLYFYTDGNTDTVATGTYLPGTQILRVGGVVANWTGYTNDNSVVIKTNGNTTSQFGIRVVNTALTDLFKVDGTGSAYVTTSTFSPIVYGSASASGTLTIGSTGHGTKGKVIFGSTSGMVFNEVDNSFSIGRDSQDITIATIASKITHSVHNTSGTYYNFEVHSASNTADSGASFLGTRSKGTYGTPLTVADDNNLLGIYAVGYDGTDYEFASAILFDVDNTVAANQVPGRIKFSTANASGTLTEAFRIDSTQYGIFATGIRGSYLTASELLGTDASKNIVSLAVATYPSLTELSYVKGLTSAVQTQLNNKLTDVPTRSASTNPADATAYYSGYFSSSTTANAQYVNIPTSGTIDRIDLYITNGGTLGSNETSSIYFRLNNTTDTLISNAVVTNATYSVFTGTGLGISVAVNDTFEIKWVTPTYATNPTSVTFNAIIYIK